jgi:hypothetical protein
VGHAAPMGEVRNVYKNLVAKFEKKKPLRRSRYRWKGNSKIERNGV